MGGFGAFAPTPVGEPSLCEGSPFLATLRGSVALGFGNPCFVLRFVRDTPGFPSQSEEAFGFLADAESSLRLSRLRAKSLHPEGTCLFALLRRLRRIKKSPLLPARPPASHRKLRTVRLVSFAGRGSLRFTCLPRVSRSLLVPSLCSELAGSPRRTPSLLTSLRSVAGSRLLSLRSFGASLWARSFRFAASPRRTQSLRFACLCFTLGASSLHVFTFPEKNTHPTCATTLNIRRIRLRERSAVPLAGSPPRARKPTLRLSSLLGAEPGLTLVSARTLRASSLRFAPLAGSRRRFHAVRPYFGA